jgi:small-conductance mechanosensitive channel
MDEWIDFTRNASEVAWIRAALAVVVSLLFAKIGSLILTKLLLRAAALTTTSLDDRLIQLLNRPIFISVVLLGIYTGVRILDWGGTVEHAFCALIQTLAIAIWTGAGWKISHETLMGLSRIADKVTLVEKRTLPLFDNLSKVVIFALGVYGFLVVWDLDLSAWLASAGIMGIAVGFAAKDSLANLFGGIFVIMDSPYKLGDYINLDSGERGQVVKIGLRSTRLLTRDDVEITLPNSHIANSKVVNESGGPHEKIRVMVHVGVAYGSDVDRVHEVLLAAVRSVESVVDAPEPYVRFMEMGDSALLFRVQGWIDEPALRGRCIDGMNTAIYKALGAANIEIPFPQRVVHLAQPTPPPT